MIYSQSSRICLVFISLVILIGVIQPRYYSIQMKIIRKSGRLSMKAESQEIKKSHYYSKGDSIITRQIDDNDVPIRVLRFYPMVRHDTEHVFSWLLESFQRITACVVIKDGLYVTTITDGELGSHWLNAFGVELPRETSQEVWNLIKTFKEL